MKKFAPRFSLAAVIVGMLLFNGCAPAVVTGGVTAAMVTNDDRSTGSLIEDQEIEFKIVLQITEELGRRVNVSTTSYNRRVLLTGQVPSEEVRRHVLAIVGNIENIRNTIDELTISNPSSLTSRAADSVLTAKVKAALCQVQEEDFSCLDIKVVTEQGVVYLMGLVTANQDKIAVNTVRNVSGVLSIKSLFEKLN